MSISKKAMQLLERLATQVATEPGKPISHDTFDGFKQGRIPHELSTKDDDPGWLTITGDEFNLYHDCLDALSQEPEFEHITRQDIDRELWGLVLEFSSRWREYRQPERRHDRLKGFLTSVAKPHRSYRVMFEVDHLAITDDPIQVGDASFLHLNADTAEKWGIADKSEYREPAAQLIEKPVGLVMVDAGSSPKALEKAREKIDTAMNVLRERVRS